MSKFRAKKTPCLHGHNHDSRAEAKRCNDLHILERGDKIHGLQVWPFFAFVIDGEAPKMGNGHRLGVKLDFSYIEDGKLVAEDVKGRSKLSDSRDWPIKRALFKHIYKAWELREVRS
jgi:hypothetical protein